MAFTCPPPVPGITQGTSIHTFTLAVVIIIPIIVFAFYMYFYINRNSSVYLRKRPLALVTCSCLGMSVVWASTVLYDYLGPDKFPCALFGFLVYMSCPLVGGPLFLKGLMYLSKVSVQTLNSTTGDVKAAARPANVFAHFKVIFCGSRSKQDRLLSAQFSLTPFFWMGWSALTVLPYLIAYFVRLATDETWNEGCSGCHLSEADCICLIVLDLLNMIICLVGYPRRVLKRDPLRIIRECAAGIGIPMPLLVATYALVLTDPGNAFASGNVDWMSFTVIPGMICVYVQTVHPVIVAKSLKRSILFSDNFDRADRFEDVMKDKDLKAALQKYLNSELSGEIILFLDACDEAKVRYAQDPSVGEAEIRAVYRMFIEKNRATYEINLPSSIRESIAQKMRGVIDPAVFDEACNDVKTNLLRDGFPRFLNYLKTNSTVKRMAPKAIPARAQSKVATRVEEDDD